MTTKRVCWIAMRGLTLASRHAQVYTTIKTKIFATTNKVNTYYYYYSALSLGNVKKDLHIGGPFWRFRERAHCTYSALSLGSVKKDRLYAGPFWRFRERAHCNLLQRLTTTEYGGFSYEGRGCVISGIVNGCRNDRLLGLTKIECYCHSDGCNSAPRRNILSAVLIVTAVSAICLQFYISRMWWYTVKTMDNVHSHFAAFLAFKTKNQRHIVILLFETLQFWFK